MPSIGVDAHRRQPAARRLVAARAPGVRLEEQRVGERHRRFDVQNRSQLARPDPLAQLRHLRVEAAVVAEPERDARSSRRRDRGLGVGLGQRERLLAEDVLAGSGGGDDLRRVQRVRRREHDRVDLRIVGRASNDSASRRPCSSANVRASGDDVRVAPATKRIASLPDCRFDERLAPPAEPDDRGPDHQLVRIRECSGRSGEDVGRGQRRAPCARCSRPARARPSCRTRAAASCPRGPCRSPR